VGDILWCSVGDILWCSVGDILWCSWSVDACWVAMGVLCTGMGVLGDLS
jgi:hypothetical protein